MGSGAHLNKRTYTVVLYSCEHFATFTTNPPKVGEQVLCRVCFDPVTVERDDLSQWEACCITCARSTYHGLHGRLAAEIAGAKHRKRRGNAEHVVHIINPDRQITRKYGCHGTQLSIDVTDT